MYVTCTSVLSYMCVYKVPTANDLPSGPPWGPEVCNIVLGFFYITTATCDPTSDVDSSNGEDVDRRSTQSHRGSDVAL